MRGAPALLAVLLAALLVLPVMPVYAWSGTATISVATYKATIPWEQSYTVDVNNSTQTITVTVPDWLKSYSNVYIKYDLNGSGSIDLRALKNGTQLLSSTIVPLSTGEAKGVVSLSDIPDTIELGSTQVWKGSITLVVESTVEFQIQIVTPTIYVRNGTGTGQLNITQVSGPAGKIFMVETDLAFDAYLVDPTPEYSGDHMVETTGAGWNQVVDFKVVAGNVQPGTYNLQVQLWFESGTLSVQIGDLSVSLASSGSSNTTTSWLDFNISNSKAKYALLGFAVAFIFALLFLVMGGGRRGMASPAAGMLLLLIFAAVIAVALTIVRPEMALAMGVGVAVFLVLLILQAKGRVRVSF